MKTVIVDDRAQRLAKRNSLIKAIFHELTNQDVHQARTAHADPMIRPLYYLPHGFVWRDPDERMDWETTHHMEE